ncbi:C3HC zinc finger-like, putative isoform 2 [Theobroma cacao]|uniref:C3HC zinc finger-like, putative isoform 2 n=1 Tax=Theobroma cacao TaxID=3641 RepID=A0A061FTX3_THECC|nr:C3HC zinc finger-like, putative isoform 2 [Theobroma cacao]
MAQNSQERFHSIMNKIFHAPKPTPSSSSSLGGQSLRGKKRPNPSSALALEEPQHCLVTAEAPLCRPWDRGDLVRRLSTFKSMTWFAKPKVVSAVNCARRGWVNVDMDIIACESCGARLLFSTPPSWTQQQVEKVALVFSLKLDSGHKLLCPWINIACEERLAEFPPIMPADLVEKFKERSCSLCQLLALPVISSSAIEFMKSPQLEEFLRQPFMLDYQKDSAEFSQSETIESGSDVDSTNMYYQAQKLISLCGWEPRSLPYVVECKDGPNHVVKDADILNLSQGVDNGRNPSLSIHSIDEHENLEANKESENSCRLQYDPKSVVLDCRLCGASVGLWTFSTVQQPVEFFRVVGYAEVSPEVHDSGHESNVGERVVAVASNVGSSSMEQSSNLKLTIAGGPPPTRQNIKATISLPVIGQSLRARLLYHPEFREQIHINQEDTRPEANCNMIQGEEGQVVPLEDMRTSNKEKDDQVNCNSTSNDQSPCSNHDSARDDIFRNLMPLEGTGLTAEETYPDNGTKDNDSSVMITSEKCHPEQIAETDKMNSTEDKTCSDAPNANSQEGVIAGRQTAQNNKVLACAKGKDLKQLCMDKITEFDPIRQHRHFCPWIASAGSSTPGWKQTLSALLGGKNFPHSSPTCSPSSASLIKVDDPIASVRKLFASPIAKRPKNTHESS